MAENHNKARRVGILWLAGLLAFGAIIVFSAIFILKYNKIIFNYKDLGVPYLNEFTEEQLNSRLAEDLTVFDGKLYVGGGDYDANTGPVYVMSYDPKSGVWEKSSEPLPDEQIKRFEIIDGRLTTLGTDPKDDWELGNYYVLDGNWQTLRVLPFGIHCFDAAEFDGAVFFGLGVNSGHYPVVIFDGESYTSAEFFKDGAPLDTSSNEIIRVYNLFEYNQNLFAFLTLDAKDENGATLGYFMELYVYENQAFRYVSGALPASDLSEIAVSGNSVYMIINETLLTTDNLTSFSAVSLGKDVKASDIIKTEDGIFVLAYRKTNSGFYEISVYKRSESGFKKLFGLMAKAPANAFCKDGNTFYMSLGNRKSTENIKDVGRVIKVVCN